MFLFIKLDSMRWFSHRRSLSPSSSHAMVSSVAACCAGLTVHCQWGWLSSFSFFCSWWPWRLTFDLDLRTWARFLYNVPNRQVWSSYA